MPKKVRDAIFLIFIVLFLLITVFVSLYASGYKFNLSWPFKFNRLLAKTGALNAASLPAGATIYLNDEAFKGGFLHIFKKNYLLTPTKIKNLLPGEYDLRLELDGYWSWQKRITIYSGQTTFWENISLFKNEEPLLIATTTVAALSLSPSRQYLYLPDSGEVLNLKNGPTRILPTKENGRWLKTGDKLFAGGWLLSPENAANDFNYNKIIGDGAQAFYYDENSACLYYQYADSLNRLEADGKSVSVLLKGEKYLTYEARGEHLFLVTTNNGKTQLEDYSLKTKNVSGRLPLPAAGSYRLVSDNWPRLSLYDEQNRTLYLIDPANLSRTTVINNVKNWQWRDDSSLFYANDWEIFLYDLKTGQAALVTRFGEALSGLFWNENKNYLIFLTATGVNVIDNNTGVITTLLKTEKITAAAFDEKNDILYLAGQIGMEVGIYKLQL